MASAPPERRGRPPATPQGQPLPAAPDDRPLIEQALVRLVHQTALHYGYLVFPSDDATFPDLLLGHPRRPAPLWALTLCSHVRQPTAAQTAWLTALQQSTRVEARVVHPGDFHGLVDLFGRRERG